MPPPKKGSRDSPYNMARKMEKKREETKEGEQER